ncbi:M18 family aminopeptidase [Immundisolibacter cernigliae]|uniref:M18 family aminopeptidase n=1 Tax=Immundisolibacter cernigliae TaxID=1810504 RepID=A0A1B1YXN2_9GAMM|nr:M18 family aminopeptidase [Immundisolibacter cernigliae]
MPISPAARARAQALLDFIDASPSPWHVVDSAAALLEAAGYRRLDEADTWQVAPGTRHYVVRDGSTLAAFRIGSAPLTQAGLRLIGAHTDSPGLRVKPLAGQTNGDWLRLGVEVYGGPILATFADRDLSLAGRVALRAPDAPLGVASRLVRFAAPLLRIPNLAIHLNRKVNEDGLKLDRQSALPPILGAVQDGLPAADHLTRLLADALGVDPGQLLGFELNVYDTQPGAFFGPQQEFIADSQLDNLGSCHAALMALLDSDADNAESSAVCFLFDHEEVGSTSAKGADGSFLDDVLERIGLCCGLGREDYRRTLARSMLVSADMAHAFHPGHTGAYDDQHRVHLNHGPVIKTNASQRYTSESLSAGVFQLACERAGVPWQSYVQRSDLACGSTIGPLAASRLGLRSVDVGNPMWAMHSLRESAGAADHDAMCRALAAFFKD